MSMQEYFLVYNGDKVFVIYLGGNSSKSYFYYPKGDAVFVVGEKGVELKEIESVIGDSIAGMVLSEPKESWDRIKNREVKWYILGKEVVADNVYVVLKSKDQFRLLEDASPNRLKYYVLRDQDPWEYKDWCCVLIGSTVDREVPNTFKKIYIDEILSNS